jgi:arsenate reductase
MQNSANNGLSTAPAVVSELGKTGIAQSDIFPRVRDYVSQRMGEFDQISDERKLQLNAIASYVRTQTTAGRPAKLTFICTHNSRRSHMGQIWSAVAASFYHVAQVETFSGGTEGTAFNPRTVAAMERAGLTVKKIADGDNPLYEVRFQENGQPLVCFSKVYTESPNPKTDYCAVMTCSEADAGCPVVTGASVRIATPYEDPKVADNTADEAAKYDERSRQICREMLYLFSELDS